MSRIMRIPRSTGSGSGVITGRVWNGIATKLEALVSSVPGGSSGFETGTGVLAGGRGQATRFLPWRLLLDNAANEVRVWPEGAYVLGPALDDTGVSDIDKESAPLYPSRYGHPWVPLVGAVYNDAAAAPVLTCPDSAITYVWVRINLNQRVVPFGKDTSETPGTSTPRYAVPVEHLPGDELGTDVLTTTNTVAGGDSHNHEVDIADMAAFVDLLELRVTLAMITYDIDSVELVTGGSQIDDLETKHYQVGWIDRTQSPARIRQFLHGPITFVPPVFTAWVGTGGTDPEGGLVDDQGALAPRGESSGDAANSGRGEAV